MTKKFVRTSIWMSIRRRLRLSSKLVVSLSIFCFLVLLGLNSYSNSSPSPSLGRRRKFNDHFQVSPPKIAFLFLVREKLPLDFLWHGFLKNADVANFSIYVHSRPGFVFDNSTTRSPFFYGRQLRNSIQVGWGEPSMIEAERLLLQAALDDQANQRFVLLSDSCIPLYNFSYTYNYLLSSSKSFVDSFHDVKDSRYNPEMSLVVLEDNWRKGSQWITLVRRHAEVISNDNVVFPIFKNYCKRRSPLELHKEEGTETIGLLFQRDCIPDEHYVPTLFLMSSLEKELARRTLTYSLWNNSADKLDSEAWHPVTFNCTEASKHEIEKIKGINHVYYESDNRTELCHCNFTSVPCFLFARKFSEGAALRLMTDGTLGPYDDLILDKPSDNA